MRIQRLAFAPSIVVPCVIVTANKISTIGNAITDKPLK